MRSRPGYATTEFWVTLLVVAAQLFGAMANVIPDALGVVAASVAAGLYAVSRGLAKGRGGGS